MPNSTILSSAVNQNFTDIATGLSDCLTRDNLAGMTAVLRAVSGTSAAPGYTFTSDTKTGIYLAATGVLGLTANALGIKVNSEVFAVASAVVSAAGSGYAVGDTITETGGTFITATVYTVATLSGSGVATVTVTVAGIYTAKPSSPVAQGSTSGSGTGATFTPTWNDPTALDYKLGITDLADAALWTKFGASSYVASIMGKANALDFTTALTQSALLTVTGVSPAPQATFKNLAVKVASNTTVTVTADAVVLFNGTASYRLVTTVSATCNLGTNGVVNALDTGTIAVSSLYFIFVINNGSTTGTLASLSATAPTLPSGYTFFARVGAVRTINASATLFGTWQLGRKAQYVVGLAQTSALPIPTNGSGAQGTYSTTAPVWQAIGTLNSVGLWPSTASMVTLVVQTRYNGGSQAGVALAPNNSYGGFFGANPPPFAAGSAMDIATTVPMLLESSSVYWTSSASGGAVAVLGWEDNI